MLRESMDAFDFGHDLILFHLGFRHRRSQVFVKGSSRYLENATLDSNWPKLAIFFDEAKPQLLSLAKKAVAFFKISRSILSWRTSSLSRLFSASMSVDACSFTLIVPSARKLRFQL